MRPLTALLLIYLSANTTLSYEPVPFTINTKKWSHVLDDHFISITINPTDLLQGKVFGLTMNSTMAILKGLAPAYVRIGSSDTAKYTFKKSRYPNDMVKPEDEYTVTETHWVVFNEVLQTAGLDVIVCLNAAHRIEGTKKWDTRNSLELISFSDSQGYNLTWQLGYEVQSGDDLSGIQFGKDLNRLRTILNAFPRYQNSKLIGPDIRIIHKKEDSDFWNDVLVEAGPTLDALTWHPRWPQPSKMKVSENSELGYEFPVDYLEWDRTQLNKIIQKSIFKNPVWIGETKRESTGTFAEGLIWARRLVLAAKTGLEVVMKQPNLMDITHPKPEYWIAYLHKQLLGKAVLETRSVTNNTDLTIITHCTNPYFWTDKPEKLQDGPITIYGVNMGGLEQKIQIKGPAWTGRPLLLFQYVLTSGSDPDSVFSQMTYLNGEPLMMTDEGTLPDLIPKVKKLERGLTMKLPPYSAGFWVVPEAKVKVCQVSTQNLPIINIETLTPSMAHKSQQNNLKSIEDINQFIVEKLKNPESESDEIPELKIEVGSSESTEKEISLLARENSLPRIARRIREAAKPPADDIQHLKSLVHETQHILLQPTEDNGASGRVKLPKPSPGVEHRIYKIAEGISDAMKTSNQQHEFDKFLEDSGLKQDFGKLLMNDRRLNAPGVKDYQPLTPNPLEIPNNRRLRRSVEDKSVSAEEEEGSNEKSSEEIDEMPPKFKKKLSYINDGDERNEHNRKQDLIVPHQPDLKGLEEKYKTILHIKLEDGKRKIDDIKKKIIQDGAEIGQNMKSDDDVTDIQEEIIKKEIELISKAEETVADILNTQKKRQETFEDMIFEELNDVKDERINTLVEIQKNHKKKENSIHKRQAPFSKPLIKTVEYIEKNFNLEPESVRKIKRSLEEKMGEIFRSYDTKKSAEVKRRMAAPKEERKLVRKLPAMAEGEDLEEKRDRKLDLSPHKGIERERAREISSIKKQPFLSRSQPGNTIRGLRKQYVTEENGKDLARAERKEEYFYRGRKTEEPLGKNRKIDEIGIRNRKTEESTTRNGKNEEPPTRIRKTEEPSYKTRKSDESVVHKNKRIEEPETIQKPKKSDKLNRKKIEEMDDDSFELFNAKKFEILSTKKSDRKPSAKPEKSVKLITKKLPPSEDARSSKHPNREIIEYESKRIQKPPVLQESEESGTIEESEEVIEEKSKPVQENIPLKLDKDRRANMLKQITNMVENLNSMEKDRGRLKRMNFDEDISTEFELDKRAVGMKRKPRDADDVGITKTEVLNLERKETKTQNVIDSSTERSQITEPTTEKPLSRLSRYRRLRKRPNRKMKTAAAKVEEEESIPKKRHLDELEKTFIDLEKKKFMKPKFRKINAKILPLQYDLPEEKKVSPNLFENERAEPEIVPESMIPQLLEPQKTSQGISESEEPLLSIQQTIEKIPEIPEPETTFSSFQQQNRELLKDLEEIIEEQHFLGQGSETIKDESKTSGSEYSGTKEMPTVIKNEAANLLGNRITMEQQTTTEQSIEEKKKKIVFNITESPKEIEEYTAVKMDEPMPATPSLVDLQDENAKIVALEFPNPIAVFEEEASRSEDVEMEKPVNNEEILDVSEPSNRKRRATFLSNRKEQEANDEDFSSEERIKRFKQMVYRRGGGGSSGKRSSGKNDIRSSGSGMGADEFLKMAGSTVRVVFDDVIPEAYGQTKTKIQNMGLSEYIKEFGNLVQQMRNLDQIFLNIGEAAIKGYIRGNRAEKGPYIQVISRKKRETRDVDDVEPRTESSDGEAQKMLSSIEKGGKIVLQPLRNQLESSTDFKAEEARPFLYSRDGSFQENKREATETGKKISSDRHEPDWNVGQLRRGTDEHVSTSDKAGETVGTKPEERVEKRVQARIPAQSEEEPAASPALTASPKSVGNSLYPELPVVNSPEIDRTEGDRPEKSKNVRGGGGTHEGRKFKMLDLSEIKAVARDTGLSDWLDSYIKDDLRQNISPWIKTTKDFIQQALTTLQRQRQLSEILARGKVNFLKADAKRSIEKRDVGAEEPSLPVFHLIQPASNKKRETQKQSDEKLIRHLRGLQPGVYVVPTDDMTNVRSEQITSEVKQKTGMPNVVTLNIYYDKKDGAEKVEETEAAGEPKITQDAVTYYQNKGWNSIASHYDQNNQFVSPMHEIPVSPNLITPAQVAPVYSADIPNSRMIQYPTHVYHYSPPPKIISTVVPNPHPVYGPVVYVQPETAFIPQPPGTKKHWRDWKVPGSTPSNSNSGWHLQYGTLPSSTRKAPKSRLIPSSAYKVAGDKKRSVGDFKINPTWSESALPFWKFFSTDSAEDDRDQSKEVKEKDADASAEDIFAENRKRAKEASKKNKTNKAELEPEPESSGKKESQGRKKRSLDPPSQNGPKMPENEPNQKLRKRSYPYEIEFEEHEVLPQWFGTYQPLENVLEEFPPHIRRSHIVSTPWSEEEEELLSTILDAEDELTLIDMDEDSDYYDMGNNMLSRLRRYPRSTDPVNSAMLKTNMIFKSPVETQDLSKQKLSAKTGMKKLTDQDSSLEFISKPTDEVNNMKAEEIKRKIQEKIENQIRQHLEEEFFQRSQSQKPESSSLLPLSEQQLQQQPQQKQKNSPAEPLAEQQQQQTQSPTNTIRNLSLHQIQSLPMKNATNNIFPQQHTDDTIYYFFKYAYDSFVKVMKSMSQFF